MAGICKLLLFFLLLTSQVFANTPYWSKTGHRVVGEVASEYLKARTRRAVEQLLDGQSLAAVANYADEIKSDRRYRKFSPWHYVNIPPNTRYSEIEPSKDGDLVQGIKTCIAILQDKSSTRDDRVFYLKMLVHLIGDLHQPLHVGRAEDKGGNDIQLQWFGKGSNLHRVWDSHMINDYGMSYTELSRSLTGLNRKERKIIQSGTLLDWVAETQLIVDSVYDSVEVGEKLSYDYSYNHWATVEQQLFKGGLRLAEVLNDIFS